MKNDKKYTKKEITEAIAYWKSLLKESGNDKPFTGKQFCDALK